MSLEGKVALVTGASMPKGIGKYGALALARDGADVAVTGFNHMEGAEAVAEEIRAMGRNPSQSGWRPPTRRTWRRHFPRSRRRLVR